VNESRSKHFDRRRVPKQKRTIPIYGAVAYDASGKAVKDQSNILFRCWNCGFVCNTDRDKLGDGVGFRIIDQPDIGPLDTYGASIQYPGSNAASMALELCNEDMSTVHLMQLDSDGNPVTVMHNFSQVVFAGCPLCGCMNYK
jgi:hypothetical protein